MYTRFALGPVERRNASLARAYTEGMRRDARQLIAALADGGCCPAVRRGVRVRVLDIGAGIGGLGVALFERLGDCLDYWMLDRDGIDETVWFGLQSVGAKYNSFVVAHAFCVENGLRTLTQVDVDSAAFPSAPFDVIVSLLSWGFHYPVATYASQARSRLADGGAVVIDCRPSELPELESCFPAWRRSLIANEESYVRVLLTRGPT